MFIGRLKPSFFLFNVNVLTDSLRPTLDCVSNGAASMLMTGTLSHTCHEKKRNEKPASLNILWMVECQCPTTLDALCSLSLPLYKPVFVIT